MYPDRKRQRNFYAPRQLFKFIAHGEAPCNYVDAAIAEVPFQLLDREIYWIGRVKRLFTAPKVATLALFTARPNELR